MAVALGLAAMWGARPLRADDSASIAEQLFLEGRILMKEGETEKACVKFQASHDADKTATGTLLNLALCNELLGKNATAWAEFRQVIAESKGRREDRVTLASEHEAKLYPKLSYLTVVVQPNARADGLQVVLDKTRNLTEAMWSSRLPIDPGPHAIVVHAPGYVDKSYDVTMGAEADDKRIDIAPLERSAETPPPPPPPDEQAQTAPSSSRRTIGYAIGATGIVAVGVGAAFGIGALVKSGDVATACPGDVCPSGSFSSGNGAYSTAQTYAHVADAALGGGAVLVIIGGVLVLTNRVEKKAPARAASLDVSAAPTSHGASMVLTGAF